MDTTQAYEQDVKNLQEQARQALAAKIAQMNQEREDKAAEATDEAKEAAQAPAMQPVTLEEFCEAYHHADIRRGDLHCRKIRGFHATERAEAVIKFEVVFIVKGDELKAEWMRIIYAEDGSTKAEYAANADYELKGA